jgi:hypothetical protein
MINDIFFILAAFFMNNSGQLIYRKNIQRNKGKIKFSSPVVIFDIKILGDCLAPLQVFNAILHSAFSAASKLRTTDHDIRRMFFFITGLASFSCLVLKHLGRLTSSPSLEDRAQKAKPSMVASAIPQNLYNLKKNAYGTG